jgi:hypothetical protein
MNRFMIACVMVLIGSACLMAQGESCECNDGTIRGPWMSGESGWSPPLQGEGPLVPFVSWGRMNFDGRGNFSGRITANIGGIIFRGTFVKSTVKVNPDCTLKLYYTILSDDIPGLEFGPAVGDYVMDILGLEAVGSPNAPEVQPVAGTVVLSKMKRIGPKYMR